MVPGRLELAGPHPRPRRAGGLLLGDVGDGESAIGQGPALRDHLGADVAPVRPADRDDSPVAVLARPRAVHAPRPRQPRQSRLRRRAAVIDLAPRIDAALPRLGGVDSVEPHRAPVDRQRVAVHHARRGGPEPSGPALPRREGQKPRRGRRRDPDRNADPPRHRSPPLRLFLTFVNESGGDGGPAQAGRKNGEGLVSPLRLADIYSTTRNRTRRPPASRARPRSGRAWRHAPGSAGAPPARKEGAREADRRRTTNDGGRRGD